MKIVILGTIAYSLYGFRADLIKALVKQQHTVYAFTSEYTQEELKKIEVLGAIPMTYNLNRGGLNPLSDIRATYHLSKVIKEISPDIVFSYFSKPVIFGTLAAKMAKIPQVVGMLEGLGYCFTDQPEGLSKKVKVIKAIQIMLYRVVLPQIDTLIFLNADDPNDLLRKYKIRVKQVEILGGIGLSLSQYEYQPIATIQKPIKF